MTPEGKDLYGSYSVETIWVYGCLLVQPCEEKKKLKFKKVNSFVVLSCWGVLVTILCEWDGIAHHLFQWNKAQGWVGCVLVYINQSSEIWLVNSTEIQFVPLWKYEADG